jgi:hypothetical protein
MLAVCNLEYPAFIKWVEANKPAGLETINTGQDIEWLVANPKMLFPDAAKKDPARKKEASTLTNRWFAIVQHRAQAQYFKKRNLDVLMLGRRRADGNYVGFGTNIYTNDNGVTRYSPISHWTHEQLLAYIAYNKLPLPPIYDWPNGFKCGTHPWPARQHIDSVESAWSEIYTIDPSIVHDAAVHFESAKKFLAGVA